MGQAAPVVWDFSCPDWFDRLKARKSLVPNLPLDLEEAERAVAIFDNLRIPDVAGQPFNRVAAGEWLRDIVRPLFGSVQRDGSRKVKSIFAMVPKKNNKTTGGAGIMLTAMLVNMRPRANFMLVAPSHEIALKAFDQAAGMIDADTTGYLKKRFLPQQHLKTIFDRRNKASLKVVTFDMKIATGSRPVGVLLDELHLMAGDPNASRILAQITGGMISTPESFIIKITTQSDQEPAGVFKSELALARSVRDGVVKGGNLLPLIYEFPEEMQKDEARPWLDPALWPLVMPNLGLSYTLDAIMPEFEKAKLAGDADLRVWASQHLNVQIGMAQFDGQWAGAKLWGRAAAEQVFTREELLRRSEVICIGIDGGGLDDLFALCLIGRERGTGRWLVWVKCWCQSIVLERRKQEASRLLDFQTAGDLTILEDLGDDIDEAVEIVKEVNDAGLLAKVGMDPYGIGAVVDAMVAAGIDAKKFVAVPQGYKLMGAIKTAERKLADGTMKHANQGVLNWAIGNAKVEQKGNAILITKQISGVAKIDPAMAMFDACALMSENPQVEASVYTATRGLAIFG